MSAAEQQQDSVFVPTLRAVRWGVSALKAHKVHPFFLAYLYLRKRAAETGVVSDIAPVWDELAVYLEVSGGPPGKPYFRPFWNGNTDDPGRYWLNPNIAGSYSPSSLRKAPYQVIETEGSHFSLRADHAALARRHLLYDKPINVIALSAFLYRDFGLMAGTPPLLRAQALEAVFCDDFRFTPKDPDFSKLFVSEVPVTIDQWFEPLEETTVGVQ